ncbi:MAG: hypothetical protein ACXWQZ_14040 [Ktedonobacterales bacterium]
MAKDAPAQAPETVQAPETILETFIVVNGTLVHDGQAFPVGAEFRSADTETIRELLACRALARPDDALQAQVVQTLDENASLRSKVRDLEREIAEARATIEKRERVI